MKIAVLLALIAALLFTACAAQDTGQSNIASQNGKNIADVSFLTEDGYALFGTHYKGPGSNIILLHMLGQDRSSWRGFAEALQNAGYNVLTIDMRGHGMSVVQSGELRDWQSFGEQDFNNMMLDVAAAKQFLGSRKTAVIGASIGANVAVNYGARQGADALVLLSPAINYRGVRIDNIISLYRGKLLVVASKNDAPSYEASLFLDSASDTELKIYDAAGHGTDMFFGTDLQNFVITWLRDTM